MLTSQLVLNSAREVLEQVFTDQLGILKIVVRCVLLGKPKERRRQSALLAALLY